MKTEEKNNLLEKVPAVRLTVAKGAQNTICVSDDATPFPRTVAHFTNDARGEIYAQLFALAYDHSLWGAAVAAGKAQILTGYELRLGRGDSENKYIVVAAPGARQYPLDLDAFGCPALTDDLRAALRAVVLK